MYTGHQEGKREEPGQVREEQRGKGPARVGEEENGFQGTSGSPKAMGEKVADNDSEDYGFEPWPTDPSFLEDLDSALGNVDQTVPPGLTQTARVATRDPISEAMRVRYNHAIEARASTKRPRQGPDSCE